MLCSLTSCPSVTVVSGCTKWGAAPFHRHCSIQGMQWSQKFPGGWEGGRGGSGKHTGNRIAVDYAPHLSGNGEGARSAKIWGALSVTIHLPFVVSDTPYKQCSRKHETLSNSAVGQSKSTIPWRGSEAVHDDYAG